MRRRMNRLAKAAVGALLLIAVIAGAATWIQSYRARQAERTAAVERDLRARTETEKRRAEDEKNRAEDEKNRAEREMYYAKISLAEKRIEEMRYDQARELLAACPKQHRNWEWGRLQWLCNLDLITLKGHAGPLSSVAFSPDRKRLATGSWDNTAIVWDSLPWRDEDLPGDASMSYDDRIQLYKIEQWQKRQEEEGKSKK